MQQKLCSLARIALLGLRLLLPPGLVGSSRVLHALLASYRKKQNSLCIFLQETNLGKSSSCHSSLTSTFSIRKVASVVPMVLGAGWLDSGSPRKGLRLEGERQRGCC